MTTTVRIPRKASEKLDRLIARILLQTGRKVSKQDLLDTILEVGLNEESLLARIVGLNFPLPDDVWQRVRQKSVDWGVETREEDIDRILYGVSE